MTTNERKVEFIYRGVDKHMVKYSYGITRVLQLSHLTTLKQHSPSASVKSIRVPRKRYKPGTPKVGRHGAVVDADAENAQHVPTHGDAQRPDRILLTLRFSSSA
jgi:hypothetical protein